MKEWKEEYLFENQEKKILTVPFNRVEKFEQIYGKDACNFVKDEIIEFISSCNLTIGSIDVFMSTLRSYTNWCIEHGFSIDNINHYDELERKDMLQYEKVRSLPTRKDIIDLCEKLTQQYAFVLLASFEGIPGDAKYEMISLTASDIDIVNSTFRLTTGEILPVSKQLAEYALTSSTSYEDGEIRYKNVDNVLKPRDNSKDDTKEKAINRLRQMMYKIRYEADVSFEISFPSLAMAGFVDTIKKRQERTGVSFELAIEDSSNQDVLHRYNLDNVETKKIIKKYKKYL